MRGMRRSPAAASPSPQARRSPVIWPASSRARDAGHIGPVVLPYLACGRPRARTEPRNAGRNVLGNQLARRSRIPDPPGEHVAWIAVVVIAAPAVFPREAHGVLADRGR